MELRSKTSRQDGTLILHLLAILMLVLIVIADWHTPYVTITPPCTLLMMGFLALKLRPRTLLIWVFLYNSAAIVMIYLDQVNWSPNAHGLRFVIRVTGLVIGDSVAVGLSIYRTKLENSYLQVLDILKKIPAALVVSDNTGNIVTVSEETARLCGKNSADMIGDSYFKYFIIGNSKGSSVQKYLELVQSQPQHIQNMDILLPAIDRVIGGSLVSLHQVSPGKEKWMLTTLHDNTRHE